MPNITVSQVVENKPRVRNPLPITELFLDSVGANGRLNDQEEKRLARAWRDNADV